MAASAAGGRAEAASMDEPLDASRHLAASKCAASTDPDTVAEGERDAGAPVRCGTRAANCLAPGRSPGGYV